MLSFSIDAILNQGAVLKNAAKQNEKMPANGTSPSPIDQDRPKRELSSGTTQSSQLGVEADHQQQLLQQFLQQQFAASIRNFLLTTGNQAASSAVPAPLCGTQVVSVNSHGQNQLQAVQQLLRQQYEQGANLASVAGIGSMMAPEMATVTNVPAFLIADYNHHRHQQASVAAASAGLISPHHQPMRMAGHPMCSFVTSARKRTRMSFGIAQVRVLEAKFREKPYLTPRDRDELASRLGLTGTQVKIWFQNRRYKIKKTSTSLMSSSSDSSTGTSSGGEHRFNSASSSLSSSHSISGDEEDDNCCIDIEEEDDNGSNLVPA